MLDIIEQSVKQHDQYQIEIKRDYELFDAKQTRYHIDTYIFVPQNLGVTPTSYAKDAFYSDVQNYVRLKTPSFNLRELAASERSPLHKLEAWLASPEWIADTTMHERIIIQFKLFSAILKSTTREHIGLIEQRVEEAYGSDAASTDHLIESLVDDFLRECKQLTSRYRSLSLNINLPNVPETVTVAYTFTDESISILIEENAIEIFQLATDALARSERQTFRMALSELIESETAHRKARGYESVLTIGDENETYLYRASVLKSYASSVLFLDTDVQRDGWQWEQVAYALAAGIAMIFATLTAFYFQTRFGNFTLPFFVALVVGYMFKDRIKEIGRNSFDKRLENYLYDRRINIRTRDDGHTLGHIREKVRFVSESDLPASVRRERNRDYLTDLSNDGRGENILCYSKEITLKSDSFAKRYPDFPPITGVNDIFRYDIRHFLSKMAEPIQVRQTVHKGQLHSLHCHKVYHVHMISRYKSAQPGTGKLRRHLRLVLNQFGIRRVEEL